MEASTLNWLGRGYDAVQLHPNLKRTVETRDTLAGRVFDTAVQALIVLSLLSFSIETLPGISTRTQRLLEVLELGTVGLFTIEYFLRLLVADKKRAFVFSFFGLVDLLAILPFYLASGLDLRSLRGFRLLRIFRGLKLLRYSKAIRRIRTAVRLAREELTLFLGAASLVLYLSAVGIYHFESEAQPEAFGSVFHSLWWAVATLTTVGYGDVYPVTLGGRIFTFLVLLVGLGVVAVPSGMLASALSEARRLEGDSQGGGLGGTEAQWRE